MHLHIFFPPSCFLLVLYKPLYRVGLTQIHFPYLVWPNPFFLEAVHGLLVQCLMILFLPSSVHYLNFALLILLLFMLSSRLYMLCHLLVAFYILNILCIDAQTKVKFW